jgi:small subunit ribosomal protein S8
MLITMKNGALVSKRSVVVPFSSVKSEIAQCLKDHGFIAGFSKKTEKNNVPVLEIDLAYNNGVSKISDVKRLSKPSRRVYLGVREIHNVKNGHGITVFSTPKGILSNKQAHKERVGGEALFMIW